MILFSEIFKRAVKLFDDPDINRLYATNPVAFAKKMRPFLINGLGKFTTPLLIASQMNQYDEPIGRMEVFEGTGTDTYVLTTVPAENSDMTFMIEGKPDLMAIYNSETKTVQFSRAVEVGQQCSVEWYYAGAFTADLTKIGAAANDATILEQTKNILAHCLLLSWAEQSKNFLLDIRNWLQDTDFKLYSPGNTLSSKVNWYNEIDTELATSMNALGWALRTLATYRAGGRINGK